MKKSLIFAAIAAVALSACAKFETFTNTDSDNAVRFGVYSGKMAITRATYGDIDTDALKASEDGFGVFAYYTKDEEWNDAKASATPNFMYNQQVTWSGSKWVYSPLKYWPNGTNSTTVETGTREDMITFFAYAPQIAKDSLGKVPATGQGITAMSANSATGAPTLTFTVPAKAEEQIDLLWATPDTNMVKPHIDTAVKFTFHHALAKLNYQVVAVVEDTDTLTAALDAATTIVLESLEVKAADTKTGTLSLYDGSWSAKSDTSVVTYNVDSFADTDTTTVNGKTGFNVTETIKDLNPDVSPMIIPGEVATGKYVVTANYWVITEDDALADGFSTVQQVIKKASTAAITFEAGKKYTILVKFGLADIDFDVKAIDDWTDEDGDPIDLPVNND